jgi:hypothetical protein
MNEVFTCIDVVLPFIANLRLCCKECFFTNLYWCYKLSLGSMFGKCSLVNQIIFPDPPELDEVLDRIVIQLFSFLLK